MPYRRRTVYGRTKKRTARKRMRGYGQHFAGAPANFTRRKAYMMTPSPRTSLANRAIVRLRYSREFALFGAVGDEGDIHTKIFRANDMFQPDSSGGGGQPYGFQDLMKFYNHFTVLGSKITIRAVPALGVVSPIFCSVSVRTQATPYSVRSDCLQVPTAIWVLSDHDQGPILRLQKYFSTRKYFNVENPQDQSQLNGTGGAAPIDLAHFILSAYNPDATAFLRSWVFYVTIEYIASLQEPKLLTGAAPTPVIGV